MLLWPTLSFSLPKYTDECCVLKVKVGADVLFLNITNSVKAFLDTQIFTQKKTQQQHESHLKGQIYWPDYDWTTTQIGGPLFSSDTHVVLWRNERDQMCSEHDCWPTSMSIFPFWSAETPTQTHSLSLHELLISGVRRFGCVIVVASLDVW